MNNNNRKFLWNKNMDDDRNNGSIYTIAWTRFIGQNIKGDWVLESLKERCSISCKQGQKILIQPNNICVQKMKAKHVKNNPKFFQINKIKTAFKAWKTIYLKKYYMDSW